MRSSASKYRHPVTIETPKATGADGYGHVDMTDDANWSLHASRRAEIIETGGREYVQRRQVAAETTHLVKVRSDATLRQWTPRMRIKWDDNGITRRLNITKGNLDGTKRREIVFECREVPANG